MTTGGYARGARRLEPASGTGLDRGALLHGTYRILGRIAVGGMAEVFVSTHERLGARCAIKVLRRDLRDNPDAAERFRREAQIMSRLRHPHIAEVFDFNVCEDGTPYLVMELLEGRSLQSLLDAAELPPPSTVAAIVGQIASALGAAHAQGVVHRDLKPDNVMLLRLGADARPFVKVFDFGISKILSARHTGDPSLFGTPEYMSPEQAQAHAESVDHRSDQFALAALAHALLAGRPPFHGDDPLAVLFQVVHGKVPPLAGRVSWPAAGVDAVLDRGLSKAPADRFPDVRAFARALAEAVPVVDRAEASAVPGLPAVADRGEAISEVPTLRLERARERPRRLEPRPASPAHLPRILAAPAVLYRDGGAAPGRWAAGFATAAAPPRRLATPRNAAAALAAAAVLAAGAGLGFFAASDDGSTAGSRINGGGGQAPALHRRLEAAPAKPPPQP